MPAAGLPSPVSRTCVEIVGAGVAPCANLILPDGFASAANSIVARSAARGPDQRTSMGHDPRIIRGRAFIAAGLGPVAYPCIVARGNLGPDVGHSVGTLLDENPNELIGPVRFQPVATRENAHASNAIQVSR